MTLPATGTISLYDVNVELGLSGTAYITLNDSLVRELFVQPTGTVDLNTGHGKANRFLFNKTITDFTYDYRLYNDLIANGWDGVRKVNATVTVNNIVVASSTGVYAFVITGIPTGSYVTIINNSAIVGHGGAGGTGAVKYYSQPGGTGGAGGPAFFTDYPINMYNNNTIGGGGGGGGGGGSVQYYRGPNAGGGGGGGGAGYGAGGAPGPAVNNVVGAAGGNGDWGSPGGGGAGYYVNYLYYAGTGGAGGGLGAAGAGGDSGYSYIGGNYGAAGGGAAGVAVTGSSYITWNVYGNVYGAVN